MSRTRSLFLVCAASLLFVLAVWGPQYARRGHWGPDEARFVYIAREMSAAHSPLIPLRNGEIYAHKPPLMMWLVQAGEALFGSPFGSRLPTLLGAFLSILALHSIGIRLTNRRTAIFAILLTASSIQFWTVLGRGQIDALLTGLVLSSAALFLSCGGPVPTARILPAFLCAGLGVLAKGPVGLVLPILIVAAVRIPDKDVRLPELSPRQWMAGCVAAMLLPALWLAAAAWAGAPKSYFREIVFLQNVSRAAGGYGHIQPFWYFLGEFPLGFLPWTILLPFSIPILWKRNRVLLFQCSLWILLVLLFFTLPSSKRAVYILSAYPAAGLLVAAAADEIQSSPGFRYAARSLVVLIPFLLLAAGAGLLKSGPAVRILPAYLRSAPIADGLAIACFAAAVLSGLCIKFLAGTFADRHAFILPVLSVTAVLVCMGGIALPAIGPSKEPRALIPLVEKSIAPTGRLLLYQMDGELLSLHANRRGRRADNDAEMLRAMADEGEGLALFYQDAGRDAETRFAPLVRETGSFKIGKRSYGWARFAR